VSGDFIGITWELGVCMFSGLDQDGFPIAQYDAHGLEPQVEPIELHHTFGFVSRPRDPEVDAAGQAKEGKACNMWFGTEGNTLHGLLGFDPRFIATFPQLKKGGAMMYSAPGSFRVMDGDDGTETMYCPVPGNKAHAQTIGLDGNSTPYVGLIHCDGMGITMLSKSIVMKNAAGDAYYEANDGGLNLNGNTKVVGSLVVGPVGAQPAAFAPPIATALGAIAQALTAIASSLNGLAPGISTAIGPQLTTIGGAALQLAAVNTKIT